MRVIDTFDMCWLSITYNCNNKCVWCYAGLHDCIETNKNLEISEIDNIIILLKDLGIRRVVLIGGEPSVYKNIFYLIKKLSDNNIDTHMVTNGRNFKNKNFTSRIKESGLFHVGVSIEGSTPLIHDSITQINGSFYDTLEGISNCLNEGIKTYTNTTISHVNIRDLINIVNLINGYGIKTINFNICGPCVSEDHDYSINPLIASKAYSEVFKYTKNRGISSKLLTATPLCNFESDIRKDMIENKSIHGGPCQLSHGKNFVIDYNGDVLPCTHLTGYPMFNIFENNKIINRDKFIDLYNDVDGLPVKFRTGMLKYPSDKCNRDKCNLNCGGGCPLFWKKFNPDESITGDEL